MRGITVVVEQENQVKVENGVEHLEVALICGTQ